MRQRPLAMAGWREAPAERVRAPHRGAARKSPGRAPFLSRPSGRLAVEGSGGENERTSPCPAVDVVLVRVVIGSLWAGFFCCDSSLNVLSPAAGDFKRIG